MKNQCKIDAGKSHTKIVENDAEMKRNWSPKTNNKSKQYNCRSEIKFSSDKKEGLGDRADAPTEAPGLKSGFRDFYILFKYCNVFHEKYDLFILRSRPMFG